jgi:outer membrane protein OmpA-like peptidoglycan-associated protein/opacity protein-like surface antigen
LGIDGGVTLPQTDYQTNKMGFAFRGTGEYFFKTNSIHLFGLKLKLGYEQVTGEDNRGTISTQDGTRQIPETFKTGIFTGGIAATYSISIGDVVFPYVSGGISNLWFDPKDGEGNPGEYNATGRYEKSSIAYSIEVGLRYLVSDKVSISLSANPYIPQTDYLDDIAAAFSDDAYTTVMLGVTISPFFNTDEDNDGISGSEDLCPEEAEDYDGYEDGDGCPEMDNDGDGILDINDKCTNEAEDKDGYEDEDGCPDLDNDGDGIPDVADKCPNEAEDKDGVEDEDGCPEYEEVKLEEKYMLMGDEIFESNSAMIKVEGKKQLDEIINKIQRYPEGSKWRIEGHMDSNGNKRFLRNLSLERAKAVLEYLSYFGGLKRENFQVMGMGDNQPVGDNNTEEGRRQNRRIEIISESSGSTQDTGSAEEEFNQFILRVDDSFEPNSSTLNDLAKILLKEIVDYIKARPDSKWRIEGYTDNQGSASSQKKTSLERAEAVYNYLISEGLSESQFTVEGLGNTNNISTNDTELGRSTNRRILIIRQR